MRKINVRKTNSIAKADEKNDSPVSDKPTDARCTKKERDGRESSSTDQSASLVLTSLSTTNASGPSGSIPWPIAPSTSSTTDVGPREAGKEGLTKPRVIQIKRYTKEWNPSGSSARLRQGADDNESSLPLPATVSSGASYSADPDSKLKGRFRWLARFRWLTRFLNWLKIHFDGQAMDSYRLSEMLRLPSSQNISRPSDTYGSPRSKKANATRSHANWDEPGSFSVYSLVKSLSLMAVLTFMVFALLVVSFWFASIRTDNEDADEITSLQLQRETLVTETNSSDSLRHITWENGPKNAQAAKSSRLRSQTSDLGERSSEILNHSLRAANSISLNPITVSDRSISTKEKYRVAIIVPTSKEQDERTQVISRYVAALVRQVPIEKRTFDVRVLVVAQTPPSTMLFKGFLLNTGVHLVRSWATHVFFLDPEFLPLSIRAFDPSHYDQQREYVKSDKSKRQPLMFYASTAVSRFNWKRPRHASVVGALLTSIECFEKVRPYPTCSCANFWSPNMSQVDIDFHRQLLEDSTTLVDLKPGTGGSFYSLQGSDLSVHVAGDSFVIRPPITCGSLKPSSRGSARISKVADMLSHIEVVVELEKKRPTESQGERDDRGQELEEREDDDSGVSRMDSDALKEDGGKSQPFKASSTYDHSGIYFVQDNLDELKSQTFLIPMGKLDTILQLLKVGVGSSDDHVEEICVYGASNPQLQPNTGIVSDSTSTHNVHSKPMIHLESRVIPVLKPCVSSTFMRPHLWRKRLSLYHQEEVAVNEAYFQLELNLSSTARAFVGNSYPSLCLAFGADISKHHATLDLEVCRDPYDHTGQRQQGIESQLWTHYGLSQVKSAVARDNQAWCLAVMSGDSVESGTQKLGLMPCINEFDWENMDILRSANDVMEIADPFHESQERGQNASSSVVGEVQGSSDFLHIIAACRHQPVQQEIFVRYMSTFLHQQGITNFAIHIVEQSDQEDFNRGQLLNVGFLRVHRSMLSKKIKDDYYVFQDIDVLPLSGVSYRRPSRASTEAKKVLVLVSRLLSKSGWHIPPAESVSPVIMFPNSNMYEEINGHSNGYWGWGFEDRDLLVRLQKTDFLSFGIPVRPPLLFGQFYLLDSLHTDESKRKEAPALVRNRNRFQECLENTSRASEDGLNSVYYQLLNELQSSFANTMCLRFQRRSR